MNDLNARLASPPDFEIVDADRLGLYVASLLAARHGVEVSLAPSPYRGTKAIVLLPDELVVPGGNADGQAGAARLRSTNALSLVGAVASPALPEPRLGEDGAVGLPVTTSHGLPRRVRPDKQPQPSEQDRPAGHAREAATPTEAPAPDDARRLAASLQRSWHRSRADDDTTDADAAAGGAPGAGLRGGWAQDNEEEA
jgi:hypothetical protein